jgi:predicted TIM-barrel fold metal-dependent hydrolase
MFHGTPVVDVHGHMSTPPDFRAWAFNLIALRSPGETSLAMSEEQQRPALQRHLRMLDERGIDVQLISARPVAMMHWEAAFIVERWTRVTNDVIHQQCQWHPDRFQGVAQLPQNAKLDTSNCVAELERCVRDLGFVAALVNPDPGADRQTPGVNDSYWYPLYTTAQELQVPLIIHPSITRDPRVELIPHNYQYNNITEETLATLLYEHSDVFDRFPELRIIVCHCGGALRRTLPYGTERSGLGSGGSNVGARIVERGEAARDTSRNLFFDTCAYDADFLSTAIKQRGVNQMLFGTEVPGSGTGVLNPHTGRPSDDILAVLDSIAFLSDDERRAIVRGNAEQVIARLRIPSGAAANSLAG